jgi:hypothetical protein
VQKTAKHGCWQTIAKCHMTSCYGTFRSFVLEVCPGGSANVEAETAGKQIIAPQMSKLFT